MFKIELENRDFCKSLYFYIVDAGEKKKKNGLRLDACIIQWTLKKKLAAGACQRPDIYTILGSKILKYQ